MDRIRFLLLEETWDGDETVTHTPDEAPIPLAYRYEFEITESRIQRHLRGRTLTMWRPDIIYGSYEIPYDAWCESGRDHRREVQEEYNTVIFSRIMPTWEWAIDITSLDEMFDFLTKRLDRVIGQLVDPPDGVPTLYAVIA